MEKFTAGGSQRYFNGYPSGRIAYLGPCKSCHSRTNCASEDPSMAQRPAIQPARRIPDKPCHALVKPPTFPTRFWLSPASACSLLAPLGILHQRQPDGVVILIDVLAPATHRLTTAARTTTYLLPDRDRDLAAACQFIQFCDELPVREVLCQGRHLRKRGFTAQIGRPSRTPAAPAPAASASSPRPPSPATGMALAAGPIARSKIGEHGPPFRGQCPSVTRALPHATSTFQPSAAEVVPGLKHSSVRLWTPVTLTSTVFGMRTLTLKVWRVRPSPTSDTPAR